MLLGILAYILAPLIASAIQIRDWSLTIGLIQSQHFDRATISVSNPWLHSDSEFMSHGVTSQYLARILTYSASFTNASPAVPDAWNLAT